VGLLLSRCSTSVAARRRRRRLDWPRGSNAGKRPNSLGKSVVIGQVRYCRRERHRQAAATSGVRKSSIVSRLKPSGAPGLRVRAPATRAGGSQRRPGDQVLGNVAVVIRAGDLLDTTRAPRSAPTRRSAAARDVGQEVDRRRCCLGAEVMVERDEIVARVRVEDRARRSAVLLTSRCCCSARRLEQRCSRKCAMPFSAGAQRAQPASKATRVVSARGPGLRCGGSGGRSRPCCGDARQSQNGNAERRRHRSAGEAPVGPESLS